EIAQADILLDGRLDVGVGRGHAWLNAPANVPLEENVERYAESLDILIKAWTNERFSYEGKHYTVHDLQVVPKPLQRPHPPIYQVGTSAKWFRRAAENGYAITLGGPAPTEIFREPARLYRRLCQEAGTKANLSWIKAIYLDEDEARAHAEARQVVVDFIRFNVDPMDAIARATAPERQRLVDAGYAFYAETDYELLRSLSYEQLVELGIVFVGTPAQVGERLAGLWHEFGFHELLVIAHFGGMQRWQALKNQELFARDVMPMLRDVARPLA
ncbi:MAG TPA: LLM class flavin-dependent oxidoreductase, partial [Polyangiaceae bacterium]|nr:LLM class flavin-dependent oxidoreductase [Polyangiaceae bacterium]